MTRWHNVLDNIVGICLVSMIVFVTIVLLLMLPKLVVLLWSAPAC